MHSKRLTEKTAALSFGSIKRQAVMFTAWLLVFKVSGPVAAEGGGAAELAAKLQDPLSNLAALMTDNTASFKSGRITMTRPTRSISSRSILSISRNWASP